MEEHLAEYMEQRFTTGAPARPFPLSDTNLDTFVYTYTKLMKEKGHDLTERQALFDLGIAAGIHWGFNRANVMKDQSRPLQQTPAQQQVPTQKTPPAPV